MDVRKMTRYLRRTIVIAIILLWNTTAVYAAVCQTLCADGDCPEQMAQTLPQDVAHPAVAHHKAASDPFHRDSRCPATLVPRKCVSASPQLQQPRPELSSVHTLPAHTTSAGFLFRAAFGSCSHSSSGLSRGRSPCAQHTPLRI